MSTPEGFIIPTNYNGVDMSQSAGRAYTGMANGQPFRFFTQEEYNALKSEQLGYEVKETTEFCEFLVDAKNKYCPRIDRHLFTQHPEILAEYQRWKEGKKSNITDIKDWGVLSHGEIGQLIVAGFYTVEQLADANDEKAMMIGTNYKDLMNKAKLHVEAKNRSAKKDSSESEALELKKALAEKDAQIAQLMEVSQNLATTVEKMQETKEEVKPKVSVKPKAKKG